MIRSQSSRDEQKILNDDDYDNDGIPMMMMTMMFRFKMTMTAIYGKSGDACDVDGDSKCCCCRL